MAKLVTGKHEIVSFARLPGMPRCRGPAYRRP